LMLFRLTLSQRLLRLSRIANRDVTAITECPNTRRGRFEGAKRASIEPANVRAAI
jgi:hypothetical protein